MTDAPLPGGDAIPLAIPGGHGHVLGSGDTVTDAWLAIIEKINAKLVESEAQLTLARQQVTDLRDELSTIRKIAKVDSLEDVLKHPAESETALRLRLFGAIATLRVELMANKGHAKLVQKVCETAANNLARAESAEAQVTALQQERDAWLSMLRTTGAGAIPLDLPSIIQGRDEAEKRAAAAERAYDEQRLDIDALLTVHRKALARAEAAEQQVAAAPPRVYSEQQPDGRVVVSDHPPKEPA